MYFFFVNSPREKQERGGCLSKMGDVNLTPRIHVKITLCGIYTPVAEEGETSGSERLMTCSPCLVREPQAKERLCLKSTRRVLLKTQLRSSSGPTCIYTQGSHIYVNSPEC